MYTVYFNKELFHCNAGNGNDDRWTVIDPELSLEVNTAGTFSCTIPKGNAAHGIQSQTPITVFDGFRDQGKILWRGRVVDIEDDFYGQNKITAEGELSFFNDFYEKSFERYKGLAKTDYVWTGTCAKFWELLIDHYNSHIPMMIGETEIGNKRIHGYVIDRSVADKKFSIEQKAFTSGMDMIVNELLEKIGGYVWLEWRIEDDEEKRILHHSAYSGGVLNQTIDFAENMIDISKCISGTEMYTAIVAEGPNNDAGIPYTIRSSDVPSGDSGDYTVSDMRLYHNRSCEMYGRIEHYEKFDSAVNYADLYQLAKDKLDRALVESMTINVSAADLSHVDFSKERFWVGKMVRCKSDIHGLDARFTINAMTIRLDDPTAETYTLGMPRPSMCAQNNATKSKAKKVEKNAVTVKNSNKKTGNVSTVTNTGYINLGDEVILAYGTVQAKTGVTTKADFSVDYSGAGFKNVPALVAVPGCASDAGTVSGVGSTIGTHVKAISKTGATVQITKTGGTNNVGVMWFAIGY